MIGFSGFADDEVARMKKLVAKLHGKVEDSADRLIHCTHVVVFDRPLKRTIKLCVGVSLPDASLVTDAWFAACESANAFVPTAPYLLSGEQASQPGGAGKAWSFNASESRKRASSDRLLEVCPHDTLRAPHRPTSH